MLAPAPSPPLPSRIPLPLSLSPSPSPLPPSSFWSVAAGSAGVVEADAFKEKDAIFRALSHDTLNDLAQAAQLVGPKP